MSCHGCNDPDEKLKLNLSCEKEFQGLVSIKKTVYFYFLSILDTFRIRGPLAKFKISGV